MFESAAISANASAPRPPEPRETFHPARTSVLNDCRAVSWFVFCGGGSEEIPGKSLRGRRVPTATRNPAACREATYVARRE